MVGTVMVILEHYQSEILPNYVLVVLYRIWAFYCYKDILVSQSSYIKHGGLKQQKCCSLTVLKATRCQQGWLLMKALRENLFQASLLASGGCQWSDIFLGLYSHHSNLILTQLFFPFLSLIRICSIGLRAHPTSRMISSQDPY